MEMKLNVPFNVIMSIILYYVKMKTITFHLLSKVIQSQKVKFSVVVSMYDRMNGNTLLFYHTVELIYLISVLYNLI